MKNNTLALMTFIFVFAANSVVAMETEEPQGYSRKRNSSKKKAPPLALQHIRVNVREKSPVSSDSPDSPGSPTSQGSANTDFVEQQSSSEFPENATGKKTKRRGSFTQISHKLISSAEEIKVQDPANASRPRRESQEQESPKRGRFRRDSLKTVISISTEEPANSARPRSKSQESSKKGITSTSRQNSPKMLISAEENKETSEPQELANSPRPRRESQESAKKGISSKQNSPKTLISSPAEENKEIPEKPHPSHDEKEVIDAMLRWMPEEFQRNFRGRAQKNPETKQFPLLEQMFFEMLEKYKNTPAAESTEGEEFKARQEMLFNIIRLSNGLMEHPGNSLKKEGWQTPEEYMLSQGVSFKSYPQPLIKKKKKQSIDTPPSSPKD